MQTICYSNTETLEMDSHLKLNIKSVLCFNIPCYNLPDLISVVHVVPLSEHSSMHSFLRHSMLTIPWKEYIVHIHEIFFAKKMNFKIIRRKKRYAYCDTK